MYYLPQHGVNAFKGGLDDPTKQLIIEQLKKGRLELAIASREVRLTAMLHRFDREYFDLIAVEPSLLNELG